MRLCAGFLRVMIRSYQVCVAPWFRGCCRFEPSCSSYARTAVDEHTVPRAMWLIARRLMRCHPFGDAGFDPVKGRQ